MSTLMLVKRNLLLFYKDKTAVFFSFMAVFVVFFLYLCFLKDAMLKPLELSLPKDGLEICNTWIIAGTLGIISLTTSLSVLGQIIHDRSQQILDDFHITMMKPYQIAMGYILSTIFITFVVALVTLGIGQWYIWNDGGRLMELMTLGKVLVILLLSISCCTCMLYVAMSFFKSDTSFSNVTTIIGTLSGFLMGIYVPIASLPSFLQQAIRLFPPSHSASLLRDVMMNNVLQEAIPNATVLTDFKKDFALQFHYGSHLFTNGESILLLCGITLLFLWIACHYTTKRR